MQASAQWIAEAVSGRLVGPDVLVTGPVVTDSREAAEGSLYVARRGEAADGHSFVSSAVPLLSSLSMKSTRPSLRLSCMIRPKRWEPWRGHTSTSCAAGEALTSSP